MSRLLFAGSLAAAAAATFAALPAQADRRPISTLDERGKPFGTAWTGTDRFETLTTTGMDDVRLVTGREWRIRASGDARALAQLRFTVEDGTLIVGRVSQPRERYGKTSIEVTAPALRGVIAAGSGAVEVERLSGRAATATVAGSGTTTIRSLDTDRVSATVAGSGGIAIAGRSERAEVTIAGSGRLTGPRFTTGAANVTVAGSGTARFRSPGRVRATIMGSGTVTVTGTTDCDATRQGSGRLLCSR